MFNYSGSMIVDLNIPNQIFRQELIVADTLTSISLSRTLEAISLKFGMWSAEVGGHVHSKNCLVSSRQHRAREVQKLSFLSSCQYTHGCCEPASWAARHTTL